MLSVSQYRKIGKQVAERAAAGGGCGNPNPRAEDGEHESKRDTDRGKFMVTADDGDPINPCNWPLATRCKNVAVLSLLIFVQAWAGGAESMASKPACAEFGVSKLLESLSTAMYLFGIGSGALVAGPISETVGRNPTYLVSTFVYLLFVLGSALASNFATQVVCRYFIGLFSSATLSINGGSVRDQFRPVKRSFVFPVIAWANVTREHLTLPGYPSLFHRRFNRITF